MKNFVQNALTAAEKFTPRLAKPLMARAWGLLEDPLAEILGLKVTSINDFEAEVKFRNPSNSLVYHLKGAELAIGTLWRRHLHPKTDRLEISKLQFQRISPGATGHFSARTQVLKDDLARFFEKQRGENLVEYDSTVLILNSKKHLVAEVQYTATITTQSQSVLKGRG